MDSLKLPSGTKISSVKGVHSAYLERMSDMKRSPPYGRENYESIKKELDVARLEGMMNHDASNNSNAKATNASMLGGTAVNPAEMRRLLESLKKNGVQERMHLPPKVTMVDPSPIGFSESQTILRNGGVG